MITFQPDSPAIEFEEYDRIRFWSRVEVPYDQSKCWNWIAGKARFGYGSFVWNESKVLAHRMSWMLHHGPIPTGMQVLHECDNPSCINPNHLKLGTHQDNMRDRDERGRHKTRDLDTEALIFAEKQRIKRANSLARNLPVDDTDYNYIIKHWYKVADVKAITGLSDMAVSRYCRDGLVDAVKIPNKAGRWYINPDDIDKFGKRRRKANR